jgi:hypothetical protein
MFGTTISKVDMMFKDRHKSSFSGKATLDRSRDIRIPMSWVSWNQRGRKSKLRHVNLGQDLLATNQ